jgi:hypothetical protein
MHVMVPVSVFEAHKADIIIYQRLFGTVVGSLLYAAGILSDVQELVRDNEIAVQELNEAKELLGAAISFQLKS